MWDSAQPLILYPTLAASLLVLVGLATGWLYGDLLALFRMRGLFVLGAAVASALFIYMVSVNPASGAERATFGEGLSRTPLYLLALAYGPGVGLLGGSLFVMLGLVLSAGHALGIFEVLLLLELVVLGWLATSPSIYKVRWAAAFNVPFACLLSWSTAGTALLQSNAYDARLLSVHWAYHQHALWAIYICTALVSLVSPEQCRKLFRDSSLIEGAHRIQTQAVRINPSESGFETLGAKPMPNKPVRDRPVPAAPAQPAPLKAPPLAPQPLAPPSSAAQARQRLTPIAVRLSKHDTARERNRSLVPEIELHSERRRPKRSLEPVRVKDLV